MEGTQDKFQNKFKWLAHSLFQLFCYSIFLVNVNIYMLKYSRKIQLFIKCSVVFDSFIVYSGFARLDLIQKISCLPLFLIRYRNNEIANINLINLIGSRSQKKWLVKKLINLLHFMGEVSRVWVHSVGRVSLGKSQVSIVWVWGRLF